MGRVFMLRENTRVRVFSNPQTHTVLDCTKIDPGVWKSFRCIAPLEYCVMNAAYHRGVGVDRKVRGQTLGMTWNWGGLWRCPKSVGRGGASFQNWKARTGHLASKYTLLALILVIYSTFSASVLKFQLFLICLPKREVKI